MSAMIPVEKILPNPAQPRRSFDREAIQELAQSIRENGLIQPILVEKSGDNYILIAGQRRLEAHKVLDRKEIKAEVCTEQLMTTEQLLLALVENIQREDMRPIDEARAYARLQELGLSVNKIHQRTGKSLPTITATLRLLNLDGEIQELINERALPRDRRVADALLSIGKREDRIALARKLARPGQSISTIQMACANYVQAKIAEQQFREQTPAMLLAAEKNNLPVGKKPERWDSFKQLGRVPEWNLVESAARATCDTCPSREVASPPTCQGCAAVVLLAQMMRLGNGGKP